MANLARWLPRELGSSASRERDSQTTREREREKGREGNLDKERLHSARDEKHGSNWGGGRRMETGSPCLNIILLEVTMRALVCPSPLDLITNSANRAISPPQHLSDDGRRMRQTEEKRVMPGRDGEETVIVKLTAVADLEIVRVFGIYGLIEETRSPQSGSPTRPPR